MWNRIGRPCGFEGEGEAEAEAAMGRFNDIIAMIYTICTAVAYWAEIWKGDMPDGSCVILNNLGKQIPILS